MSLTPIRFGLRQRIRFVSASGQPVTPKQTQAYMQSRSDEAQKANKESGWQPLDNGDMLFLQNDHPRRRGLAALLNDTREGQDFSKFRDTVDALVALHSIAQPMEGIQPDLNRIAMQADQSQTLAAAIAKQAETIEVRI